MNDVLTWLDDITAQVDVKRVYQTVTHPPGDDIFSVPRHPLQLFSRFENPRFYTESHPSQIGACLGLVPTNHL